MANVNAPFGLRPMKYFTGAPYNGACNYYFATGASGAIFVGDPVALAGSSNTADVQGYPAGSLPTVIAATAGDAHVIHGVCIGVLPVTRDSTTYRENSTDRVIMVADDPNLIFEVQTDAASTAWAATDVGSYANLLTGTGSAVTGLSAFTGDTTDGPDTVDASNQLLIMRLSSRPNNAIGANSVWEVIINNHGFAQAANAGRASGV